MKGMIPYVMKIEVELIRMFLFYKQNFVDISLCSQEDRTTITTIIIKVSKIFRELNILSWDNIIDNIIIEANNNKNINSNNISSFVNEFKTNVN